MRLSSLTFSLLSAVFPQGITLAGTLRGLVSIWCQVRFPEPPAQSPLCTTIIATRRALAELAVSRLIGPFKQKDTKVQFNCEKEPQKFCR